MNSYLFVVTYLLCFCFSTGWSSKDTSRYSVEDVRFRESATITNLHKYYVSVSNIKYSEKAQALQMVTRFFIDDLQEVLNARNEVAIELGVAGELSQHKKAIQKYLDLKLISKINGLDISPQYLGGDYDGDQIVLYIELPTEDRPQSVSMKFDAFFEVFEEQKNLIHFKINGERKTMILERGLSMDTVKF
jgi:hypothetical protein